MNKKFSFCVAAEGTAGNAPQQLWHCWVSDTQEIWSRGAQEAQRRAKRLWLKWTMPESPPAQDKSVTASLRARGSSQVWQHSQNTGGLTDLGRQSHLLRTRGKFPLFYPWQWKQTVLAESWPLCDLRAFRDVRQPCQSGSHSDQTSQNSHQGCEVPAEMRWCPSSVLELRDFLWYSIAQLHCSSIMQHPHMLEF